MFEYWDKKSYLWIIDNPDRRPKNDDNSSNWAYLGSVQERRYMFATLLLSRVASDAHVRVFRILKNRRNRQANFNEYPEEAWHQLMSIMPSSVISVDSQFVFVDDENDVVNLELQMNSIDISYPISCK